MAVKINQNLVQTLFLVLALPAPMAAAESVGLPLYRYLGGARTNRLLSRL